MAVSTLVVCFLFLVGLRATIQDVSQNEAGACQDVLPRSCKDVRAVEKRKVVTLEEGIQVLCDTKTDGGGWTIIQRRVDRTVEFYQNWTQYKYGFGDLKRNFWFGNEKIHRLTALRQHQLRVDFTYENVSYYAKYTRFMVMGEAENYKLIVNGYTGTAGDDLSYHNDMYFTTPDRDNDNRKYSRSNNCAIRCKSGWWFNNCIQVNMNVDNLYFD